MKTVTLDGFVKLPANDLAATMAAVAVVGPMAVNVQANTWSRYESGVFPSSEVRAFYLSAPHRAMGGKVEFVYLIATVAGRHIGSSSHSLENYRAIVFIFYLQCGGGKDGVAIDHVVQLVGQ